MTNAFRTAFLAAIAASAPASLAQVIAVDTGSLPTTQPGWAWATTGLHTGFTAADYYATDGSTLSLDSMDQSVAFAPGSARTVYDLSGTELDEGAIITATLRARVLESQVLQYNFGFQFAVSIDGRNMSFGLSTDTVTSSNLSNYAYDTTDWHTYTMVGDWDAGTYTLSIDGVELFTQTMSSASTDFIAFGDGTGTGNARLDVSKLSVAIPSTGAMALFGLAGLGLITRRP